MLNIEEIKNGLVIDHIESGLGWKVFKWLGIDNVNFTAALVMNAASKKSGKKDMIKIDNIINIDYSILGYIDSNITVNIIQDSKIVKKIKMELTEKIRNIIECINPRCITTTEHYVPHEFRLANKEKKQYRCVYCDATYSAGTIGAFEEE